MGYFNIDSKYKEVSHDSIREQLMDMTIKEILNKRLVSREWKEIIDSDSFWCRLLDRDYNDFDHKHEKCQESYKYIYNPKFIYGMSKNHNISDAVLKYFEEKVKKLDWKYWHDISEHQVLSETFIEKYHKKFPWKIIFENQVLSEEFIEKILKMCKCHIKWVEWSEISEHQVLSEEFIEKFQDKVFWGLISEHQVLSEEFIEKFQYKVFWGMISECQILSEEFIERFEDKLNWNSISRHQKLSEEFIEKFRHVIYWQYIVTYQNISKKFIENMEFKYF
jgi:hypothetical protein